MTEQTMDRASPRPNGFTLMEVLMVLMILGIMAGFAMPPIGRSLASVRADRTAATIAADMRLAYSLASRQNSPTRLSFDEGDRSYQVSDRASGTTLVTRHIGTGAGEVGVQTLIAEPTSVEVFPTGLASSSLDVTIRLGTQARRIHMTRAGYVQVRTL